MALSREDIDALGEQRFVATGMDFLGRVLTVIPIAMELSALFRQDDQPIKKRKLMNDNEFEIEMKDEYDMSQAKRGPIVPPSPN